MKRKKILFQLLLILFSATLCAQLPENLIGTWDQESTSGDRGWITFTQDSTFLQFENQDVITVDSVGYESDTLYFEYFYNAFGIVVKNWCTQINESTYNGKENWGHSFFMSKRKE